VISLLFDALQCTSASYEQILMPFDVRVAQRPVTHICDDAVRDTDPVEFLDGWGEDDN